MVPSVLCTICARGGSKGVKNKNIRELAGKPLIVYTIEQALESGLFEHIVISTDSDEIAELSQKNGAEVFFRRDAVLASDTAGKLDVIRDAFVFITPHKGAYNRHFKQLSSHNYFFEMADDSIAMLRIRMQGVGVVTQ